MSYNPGAGHSDRRLACRLRRERFRPGQSKRLGRRARVGVLNGIAEAGAAGRGAAQTEALLEKQQEQVLRLQAEFDNFRKRSRRELEQIKSTATIDLMAGLLPAIDNFNRALDQPGESFDGFVDGVRMIQSQISGLLRDAGLTKIEAEGTPFDPNLHEAVMVDSSGDHPENNIVEVLQDGYQINGKLVRPAMVKVSRPA